MRWGGVGLAGVSSQEQYVVVSWVEQFGVGGCGWGGYTLWSRKVWWRLLRWIGEPRERKKGLGLSRALGGAGLLGMVGLRLCRGVA